jgi:hypothetical protein
LGGGGQEFGLFVNSNDDKQQAVKITNQRLFSSKRYIIFLCKTILDLKFEIKI